jgi:hypothetical protein
VAEQARIAELVRDLDRRLEAALAEAERDRALPHVRPQASAQLLIKLADLVELEVDLRAWGRDKALCRAVAAVELSR